MFTESVHQAVAQLSLHTAGLIPDPAPAPPDGSNALVTFFSWAKWVMLLSCAMAAAIGGGFIGLGNLSRRAELAERGKVTLLCSMGAAVLIALAATLVSSSYSLG